MFHRAGVASCLPNYYFLMNKLFIAVTSSSWEAFLSPRVSAKQENELFPHTYNWSLRAS